MIKNVIDSVYCLCVDKRKKMWSVLENDCKACLGIPLTKFVAGDGSHDDLQYDHVDIPYDPRMNQYVGYSPKDRIHINFNIFCCHRTILERAIDKNETILLLEDDAVFLSKRWYEVYYSDMVQSFLASDQWDMIFFGYWQRLYEGDKVYGEAGEQRWREYGDISIKPAESNVPGRISGLHGAVIHKDFLSTLMRCPRSPLDSYINNNLDKFRIYYLEPQIITARSNFSFCEGSYIQREELE